MNNIISSKTLAEKHRTIQQNKEKFVPSREDVVKKAGFYLKMK